MGVEGVNRTGVERDPTVQATATASRVTPVDGPTFGEVMRGSAQSLLRGATAAARTLPVGPIVAASVRPGPGGLGDVRMPGAAGAAEGVGAGGGAAGQADEAVEAALARSQDMNLYLLEIQERIASENRAFTTLSNVLKARHETVKNAINNIR